MQAKELFKNLKSGQAPCIVDVRSGFEYRTGHIPGALHLPFLTVLLRLSALPKDKQAKVVLTCEHGPRAQLAQSMLRMAGYRNLDLLDGHMSAWRRANLPMEK